MNNNQSALTTDSLQGVIAFHRVARSIRSGGVPFDLSWERLSALNSIVQKGPISISELSVAENVTSPTMSRLVSRLESHGLVRGLARQRDRRFVLIVSTAKGRTVLHKALLRSIGQLADVLSHLEHDELRAMAEMLRNVPASKGQGTVPSGGQG
jgi:DNA-binding MarR family transcriptional regulator